MPSSGTIITFRDDGPRPQAELVLCNGDRVRLALDHDGLVITTIGQPDHPTVLFKASPHMVGHICAGLIASPRTVNATPLNILVSAVVQLGSAAEVRAAFEQAAAQVG